MILNVLPAPKAKEGGMCAHLRDGMAVPQDHAGVSMGKFLHITCVCRDSPMYQLAVHEKVFWGMYPSVSLPNS